MSKNHYLFFLLLLLIALPSAVHAQNLAYITGKLTDTSNHMPVKMATVGIYRQSDSALLAFKITNEEGAFKLYGLEQGTRVSVIITHVGYGVYQKDTIVSGREMDLGTIVMTQDSRSLDMVLVKAHRPPVSVKNDTLEFNAGSFKTLPNAVTEDLLKKLPGAQVDKSGNITINGVKVNRIVVDGKEFFGDNTSMALKNLPANVVDKVQVTIDKEAQLQNPQGSPQEVGQVINLKLKKGVKKGWFGKLFAGSDAGEKYQSGGIVNLYRDTFQVSVIGFSNNINTQAFNYQELRAIGGMDRSGITSWQYNPSGGTTINGLNLGGSRQGITKSSATGFNLNALPNNKLTLNMQYYWSASDNHSEMLENTRQLLNDSQFNTLSSAVSDNKTSTHNIQLTGKYAPDTVTRISISPYLTFSNTENTNREERSSSGAFREINNSLSSKLQTNNTLSYGYRANFGKTSRKNKRRQLLLYSSLFGNASDGKLFNNWRAKYYEISDTLLSSTDQLRNSTDATLFSNNTLEVSLPVGKMWKLKTSFQYSYRSYRKSIETFFPAGPGNEYTEKQELLSASTSRDQQQLAPGIGLSYSKNGRIISGEINFNTILLNTKTSGYADLHKMFFTTLQSFYMRGKSSHISYYSYVNAPSADDIQPLLNNTNPLYQSIGNPDLKPSVVHRFYYNNYRYNTDRTNNYYHYIDANYTRNDILRRRTIDSAGVQYTTPENINGNSNLSYRFGYEKEIKKISENFTLTWSLNADLSYSRSALYVNNILARQNSYNLGPSADIGLNINDVFEFTPEYSYNYSYATYTNNVFNPRAIRSHEAGAELILSWPGNFVWSSTVSYVKNIGVSSNITPSYTLWNGAVAYQFGEKRATELKFSVHDILNQNISIYRTVQQNYINETSYNALRRYFMLTLTHNIRNFGKRKNRHSIF